MKREQTRATSALNEFSHRVAIRRLARREGHRRTARPATVALRLYGSEECIEGIPQRRHSFEDLSFHARPYCAKVGESADQPRRSAGGEIVGLNTALSNPSARTLCAGNVRRWPAHLTRYAGDSQPMESGRHVGSRKRTTVPEARTAVVVHDRTATPVLSLDTVDTLAPSRSTMRKSNIASPPI